MWVPWAGAGTRSLVGTVNRLWEATVHQGLHSVLTASDGQAGPEACVRPGEKVGESTQGDAPRVPTGP